MSAAKPQLRAVVDAGTDPLEELLAFLATNDARTDMDVWRRADLTLAALSPRLPMATGHGRSATTSALSFRSAKAHAEAEKVAKTAKNRGLLVDGKVPEEGTFLSHAETAYVWEPGERVGGASFGAHAALKYPKYENRKAILTKLAKRQKHGRVSEGDVALWRSEQARQKKKPLSFLELFDRRIVHAINAQVRPSFSLTTEEDLGAMAQILKRRANQLLAGEQPKENN